jgi:hypothetical protein
MDAKLVHHLMNAPSALKAMRKQRAKVFAKVLQVFFIPFLFSYSSPYYALSSQFISDLFKVY